MKNLPLAPLAPPPKLSGKWSSFEIGGTFARSFLPPPPLAPPIPLSGAFDRPEFYGEII